MIKSITAVVIILITVACDDPVNDDPYKITDGVYVGTFSRTHAWLSSDSAKVTISFYNNSWAGQSDKINFPVLGEGTCWIENKMIKFTNSGNIIPESDTTLILSGKFQFKHNGQILEIYRYYYSPLWGWDMPDEDQYLLIRKE